MDHKSTLNKNYYSIILNRYFRFSIYLSFIYSAIRKVLLADY